MNNPVLLIAHQEFILNRRNKCVASFAVLFAILTLAISYFGMVTSGYSGFQDFARTSTSLVKLSGFLIPLFALLLGVFSFISHREYLELMITQPLTRRQVILGKYLGLVFTLVGATVIGFTIPGILISLVIGIDGALGYALTVLFSMLLGLVFLGCAILISQISNRQQIAVGISIGVWIFFEVLYGLLIIGTTIYFSADLLQYVLLFALGGNPIDIVRVLSLIAVSGLEFFGPAGATLFKLAGSELTAMGYGIAGLTLWIIVPLMIALKRFSRQNV
ncbi:MAG: ABC transporter permease [Bacteroidetes bacterium]|nr:ABC transporter permease [Bacteroidota bacterium]